MVADGNFEVRKSPIGDEAFCREYSHKLASKQHTVLEFLSNLADPQVSYYLLRQSVNASRMNYLLRTTPPTHTRDAAAEFDASVLSCLQAACGLALSDGQRAQATLPVRLGGLGLRSAAESADAAYTASRAVTHSICCKLSAEYRWDVDFPGSHLACATERLKSNCPSLNVTGDLDSLTQRYLNKALEKWQCDRWTSASAAADQTNAKAHSAPGAGAELGVTPSKTLDKQLTRGEFVTVVSRRLGVDVMDGGVPCTTCGQVLDSKGIHCMSCMGGGDHTVQHNAVRDVYFDFCSRGRLRPTSEAPSVLADVLGRDDRHRPADILCVPALVFARRLPDGSRAVRTEPVCFDFAVINALGLAHWDHTNTGPARAAEAYGDGKKSRNNTDALCTAAGYRFWPVIHEVQGGTSKEADTAQRAIAEAVATAEGRSIGAVLRELRERLALVISRCCSKTISARMPAPVASPVTFAAALLLSDVGGSDGCEDAG